MNIANNVCTQNIKNKSTTRIVKPMSNAYIIFTQN
jgi:hypothetical protein